MASLREQFERMKSNAARMKEKAAETIETGIQTVEVVGATFGFGVLRGRYADPETGEWDIMGVPPDLLAGIALHGAALLGGFAGQRGDFAMHAHNLGDGCLSSYFFTKGAQLGVQMREEGGVAGVRGRRVRRQIPSATSVAGATDASIASQMASAVPAR